MIRVSVEVVEWGPEDMLLHFTVQYKGSLHVRRERVPVSLFESRWDRLFDGIKREMVVQIQIWQQEQENLTSQRKE